MSKETIKLQALREPPERVGEDVIYGCSIVTAGEALGHGVHLDESFIQECYDQAKSLKLGLKARFGHPQMCSEALGTNLGRFKNFRISEDNRQLFGDLHLAESAHQSPHGDIASYVQQYAKDDPESFGTSICFKVGGHYRKDKNGDPVEIDYYDEDIGELSEELYVKCEKLTGCDFVDEPAANPEGLFSNATPAGAVSKFLSENPDVERVLLENDNIIDIIEQYGVKIKQYLKGNVMKDEDIEKPDSKADAIESFETSAKADCPKEDAFEEQSQSVQDFKDLLCEFGSEIAVTVFDCGGNRENALELQVEELKAQINSLESEKEEALSKAQALSDELDEYKQDGTGFQSEPEPKKRSLTSNIIL